MKILVTRGSTLIDKVGDRPEGNWENAMNNIVHLETVRAEYVSMEPRNESRGPSVFLREVRDGMWIVHDESDTMGGCFRDRASAFKFVADEFGADAVTVIHPRFSTPAERYARSSVAFSAVTTR
jgi:hypothetical protein